MISINFRNNPVLKLLALASLVLFILILYSFQVSTEADAWYFPVFICFIAVTCIHSILSLIGFKALDRLDKILFVIVPLPLLGYLIWLVISILFLAKTMVNFD